MGTSLIVIIPEGIETIYNAGGKGHLHNRRDIMLNARTLPTVNNHVHFSSLSDRAQIPDADFVHGGSIKAPSADTILVKRSEDHAEKKKPSDGHKSAQQLEGDDDSTEGQVPGHSRVHPPPTPSKESHKERDPHAYVGISLILGFILMYLVDVLPQALSAQKATYQPLHISLSDLSRGPHNASTATLNDSPSSGPEPSPQGKASSTTIGLMIHACADGIALGASSTAPSTSLSLIIFLAIMLHKAPAAFGLTSVLLKQGLSKRTTRTHLLLFSLAAPVGALVTWFLVQLLGAKRLGEDGLEWWTGCVLLFSGGTFLYVAMHSMTETTSPSDNHSHDSGPNGYADPVYGKAESKTPSKGDIAVAVVGMLLPLLTQAGHAH